MSHLLNLPEPSLPAATSITTRYRADLWLSLLIIIITAAVYSPVVTQTFSSWDDPKHVGIIWKPGWERAWRIVTDVRLQRLELAYYSPLHFLSLMADQALLGARDKPEAWISKVNNVLFHIADTLLLFLLLLLAGTGRKAAVLGSLVFALHPLQVGTVAWIVERKNVLAVLFYLSSLLMFVKYLRTERPAYFAFTVLLFVAGLLSKPAVVTLPAACIAWFTLVPVRKPEGRGPYMLTAVLLLIAAGSGAYVILTEVSYPGILPSWPYRPLLAAGSIWFYLSKFLFPHELVVIYPRWDVVGHAWKFQLLFAALVVVIGIVIRYRKHIDPVMLWGGVFFLLNVLPVSGFIPFGHMTYSYVADHFIYLPMVGLAVVAARGLDMAFQALRDRSAATKALLVGACGLLCVLGLLTVRQTLTWKTPSALWEATLRVNKTSYAVYLNYGWVALQQGDLSKAMELFQKARDIEPRLHQAYQNMGIIYAARGDLVTAQGMLEKAAELRPDDDAVAVLLGAFLGEQKKYDEAIRVLKKSLEAKPHSAAIRTQLGVSYFGAGRESEALQELSAATKLDPLLPDPYMQKAQILLVKGDADEAITLLKKAISLRSLPAAHNMLGAAYAAKGNLPMALSEFLKAYKLAPHLAGVRDNLANVLMDMARFSQAREFCLESERAGSPCSADTLLRLKKEATDH